MPTKYDHIYFPSQYSHLDFFLLFEDSLFKIFQDSQEDSCEFHDPVVEWLEQPYLESSITNNKFWPFLMLVKQDDRKEDAFTRIFQGLFDYGFR